MVQVDNFSLTGSSNEGAPDERLRLSFRAMWPLLAGAEVVQSYTNLGWPYFASVGACAQIAASVATEQCPGCQAKLALRAELGRPPRATTATAAVRPSRSTAVGRAILTCVPPAGAVSVGVVRAASCCYA